MADFSATALLAARRALQQQRVRTLYRQSLKNLMSWCIFRDLFYTEADKLRAEFETNKNETNVDRIDRLIAAGEEKLQRNHHPDPYTVPWYVGGSKYARNPPVPEEIHVVLDFGKQEDA
eukprot:TRINITY_DN4961_c0_g1_i3.p1 TRINITY_DN4961_c0_g1~~TRINITY_DN4961_c0_g1_i3.p1  ORF type:complete len:138 (+),score=35.71 TRINITY_DN4961_c0_g1_i3:58-414(+)